MKIKASTRILAFVLMLALVVPMLVFNVSAEDTVITFNLGANGSAAHVDGNTLNTYNQTVDGYKLSISGSKMYGPAFDAKGNSCLKFGTSSAVGSCSFTVPEEVTSVVLYVAKYKSNTTKITVNGTAYTLTKNSNNGEYDAITVDTTTTKNVSFTTVSGGVRAMLNTIEFHIPPTGEPSISLAGNDVLQVGETVTMEATPTNIEGDVVWTSSNPSVATVEGGVVIGVTMGTATITASIGEVQQTKDITVYPVENSTVTVAEAGEIAALAGESSTPYSYTVIGTVESIEDAYSAQYGNITVMIADETGSMKVYRMTGGENLTVGQKIAVSGKLAMYSGKPQIAQGSSYERILDNSMEAVMAALEALELKMSLAYKYETEFRYVEVPEMVTDTLNNAFTGVGSVTSYKSWSDKTGTSGAVYAGNNAGDAGTIQLRSNTSTNSTIHAGIVTTASGGTVKKITITWNSKSSTGRTIDIYGSDTAYATPDDLYAEATAGTKIGSLQYDGSTMTQTLEFTGDYAYIGIRSNYGALYLDEVNIEWASDTEGGATELKEFYQNSNFAFRFAVDAELMNIKGLDNFGIMISAGGKDRYFAAEDGSWTEVEIQIDGELKTFCAITVELGDIINDLKKLDTVFTMRAYVEVDRVKYVAENSKEDSVVDMIAYYCDILEIEEVTHLYDYLANNNLI